MKCTIVVTDRRCVFVKNGCYSVLYTSPSVVFIVTLEWSEIMGHFNISDTVD